MKNKKKSKKEIRSEARLKLLLNVPYWDPYSSEKKRFRYPYVKSFSKEELVKEFRSEKGNWSIKLFDEFTKDFLEIEKDEIIKNLKEAPISKRFSNKVEAKHKKSKRSISLKHPFLRGNRIKLKADTYIPDFLSELYKLLREYTEITEKEAEYFMLSEFDIKYKIGTISTYKKQ